MGTKVSSKNTLNPEQGDELGVVASVAMHEGLDFVILWDMKSQDRAAAIM